MAVNWLAIISRILHWHARYNQSKSTKIHGSPWLFNVRSKEDLAISLENWEDLWIILATATVSHIYRLVGNLGRLRTWLLRHDEIRDVILVTRRPGLINEIGIRRKALEIAIVPNSNLIIDIPKYNDSCMTMELRSIFKLNMLWLVDVSSAINRSSCKYLKIFT